MKKEKIILGSAIVLLPILAFVAPSLLALVLIAGIIILRLKYPVIKGMVGEWYVNRLLSKLDSNYHIYHDLYVPNGEGGTTQVDHVVTSTFGIFVIETKHYKGWIFGKENQRYWTQVIYKRKEKLYNPIWQNYGHVQALKKYFGKEDFDSIFSIIAFSQNSTFKFKEHFTSARVIQFPELIRVIQEWKVHRVSEHELKEMNRALQGLMANNKKKKTQIKKQHVESIKSNQIERGWKKVVSIQQNVCPKCDGELSEKSGKYGSFYGCSNFPKCRYTKQVS
jgi:hypothetical protein